MVFFTFVFLFHRVFGLFHLVKKTKTNLFLVFLLFLLFFIL